MIGREHVDAAIDEPSPECLPSASNRRAAAAKRALSSQWTNVTTLAWRAASSVRACGLEREDEFLHVGVEIGAHHEELHAGLTATGDGRGQFWRRGPRLSVKEDVGHSLSANPALGPRPLGDIVRYSARPINYLAAPEQNWIWGWTSSFPDDRS